jgi:hypothetical protein
VYSQGIDNTIHANVIAHLERCEGRTIPLCDMVHSDPTSSGEPASNENIRSLYSQGIDIITHADLVTHLERCKGRTIPARYMVHNDSTGGNELPSNEHIRSLYSQGIDIITTIDSNVVAHLKRCKSRAVPVGNPIQ